MTETANPEGRGLRHLSDALDSGDFQKIDPASLDTLYAHAMQKSSAIDTSHHEYHDYWKDVADVIERIQPELKAFQEADAHASNEQGEPFDTSAEEARKNLVEMAAQFRDLLNTAVTAPSEE